MDGKNVILKPKFIIYFCSAFYTFQRNFLAFLENIDVLQLLNHNQLEAVSGQFEDNYF